jgi:hypothetical protein
MPLALYRTDDILAVGCLFLFGCLRLSCLLFSMFLFSMFLVSCWRWNTAALLS